MRSRLRTRFGYKTYFPKTVLIDRVFNLITKGRYYGKPTYQTIEKTIIEMKNICADNNIKYLAMPKIGCGLDRLSWGKVREIIKEQFKDIDIEILVCSI
jgi:O-acetyl-ADP-ribose deacetylase (regulator of RNase III)